MSHPIHDPHPDTHTHGLAPGCARCEQLAELAPAGLDAENKRRLAAGVFYTALDEAAARNMQTRQVEANR